MMTSIQNVVKCVNRAGIEVSELVLEPLASAYSVLSSDEMELGCAVLDIGGGTTDLAVFHEEAIRYTSIIGLGGKNVTSDIAIGLRTPTDKAESIKIEHGCALKSMIPPNKTFQVEGTGGREARTVSLDIIGMIVEPRMEELFTLARHEIEKTEYAKRIGAGIVLTGGASLLRGSAELAEQVFDMPVKIGYPRGFNGLTDIIDNPLYATVLGLIVYGTREVEGSEPFRSGGRPGSINRTFDGIKKWFKDFM